jgi:hypothetical protein
MAQRTFPPSTDPFENQRAAEVVQPNIVGLFRGWHGDDNEGRERFRAWGLMDPG